MFESGRSVCGCWFRLDVIPDSTVTDVSGNEWSSNFQACVQYESSHRPVAASVDRILGAVAIYVVCDCCMLERWSIDGWKVLDELSESGCCIHSLSDPRLNATLCGVTGTSVCLSLSRFSILASRLSYRGSASDEEGAWEARSTSQEKRSGKALRTLFVSM